MCTERKCPACGSIVSSPLPKLCPVCQLEGINRMFLTREDYEEWKKTILDEHIKNLRLVGKSHILSLRGDGRLYQFINNEMELIAENVISAAAGYNYSIYLDSSGQVHFLGNSGIPFKERFSQGDLVFKSVYANTDIDIFGAENSDGNFYIWGDNHSELIESLQQRLVCEWKIVKVGYWWEEEWYYATAWSGPINVHPHSSNLDSIEFEIKTTFMESNSDLYEGNVEIISKYMGIEHIEPGEFPDLSKEDYFRLRNSGYTWTRRGGKFDTYRPEVYLTNRYIFCPQIGDKNLLEHYKKNRMTLRND